MEQYHHGRYRFNELVFFPILSRNRFAICLRGIAQGAQKVVLMLSYPSDEVGNELITLDQVDQAGVNPYSDVLTLEKYRALFGENRHPFTNVDYVQYYGDLILLGSNKSTENTVKLFPPAIFLSGRRRELADPCVSVANTPGLEGTPNEIKLKYLADNDFADLSGDALRQAVEQRIREKKDDLVGDMASQGTTPRRITDLIGSLCDLTSGSGDKGTPVVLVQGYFDNLTD